MERLASAELARMRAEHVAVSSDSGMCCAVCICLIVWTSREAIHEPYPCDAARLLAHFAPVPVPHLAGIAVGILGPVSTEELS